MGSGRVPEMWDLGEYQKGGIWASTRNVGSGRVPEMWDLGEYRKGRNPGEMLENPKQAKRSKQT